MPTLQTLTREDIKKSAPAVFANQPANRMSDKYVFIPTHTILDQFAQEGWVPVKANQAKTKKDDSAERQHIVRLANPSYTPAMPEVGSITPQIILKNSHNGTSGIQLDIGLFRLVCSNGLVVCNTQFAQIKRRHMGIDREEVMKVIYEAGRELPDIWSKINDYRSINLTNGQRMDFARQTIRMNWGENSVIEPEQLLVARRSADESDDLFSTYNVIQENITKGGVMYNNPRTGRLRRTRAIKDSQRDFYLNKNLWMLMEGFRTSKKFG